MSAPSLGDTHPHVRRVLVERMRELSIAERAEHIGSSFLAGEELVRAGLRLRYPDASDAEVRVRAGALRIGDELARRAFDWDVREKGR